MSALKQHTCLTCGAQLVPVSAGRYHCPCCGNNYDEEKQSAPIDALLNADAERMSANFSKAETLYQRIIQAYPNADLSDAYWGLFLCEQRCMFESEENDTKRFPSFYDIVDRDVQNSQTLYQAIACAESAGDFDKANIYRELAKSMAESKKKYNTIKETAAPYDVFICFKKSRMDGKGDTVDLKLARNIYNQLCKDYNVFFSEESLNTIVVRDYEPNIYYALYTAKVMLVLCSDSRYINAKWVKNEWSRFIQMSKNTSEHKTIIPIFSGKFTAEQLPDDLKSFQGLRRDENLLYALRESIREIVNPTDKNAELNALRDDIESLKKQNDEDKGKYVDNSSSRNATVALADDFFKNGQYEDAKTQYMNCCVKYSNDFYSRYMTALCDIYISFSETKLNALSNATIKYIKAASSDKRTSEQSIITALSELHRLNILELDDAVKSLNSHTDVFGKSFDHDDFQWRYEHGKRYFNEYESVISSIVSQYREFIKELVKIWATADQSKLSAKTVSTYLDNARKILPYCDKSKYMDIKEYTVTEQKYNLYLHIISAGDECYTEQKKVIPSQTKTITISESTQKLIKSLTNEISQYQSYVSGIEYYNKGDMMKALEKLRKVTMLDVKDILKECAKATAPTRYEEAISLFNQQQYDQAREQFKKLGDYRDSKQLYAKSCVYFIKLKYVEACKFYEQGQYDQAKEIFTLLTYGVDNSGCWNGVKLPPTGYKNSAEMLQATKTANYRRIIEQEKESRRPLTITVCIIFGLLTALLLIFGSMPSYLLLHISSSGIIAITVIGIVAVLATCFISGYFVGIDVVTIIMAVILGLSLVWFSVAPLVLL